MNNTKIRIAQQNDLPGIKKLIDEFAQGHPSKDHERQLESYRNAYFGKFPAAEIIVAERNSEILGIIQFTLMFDMFWCIYHANPEWFFVREKNRRSGICFSLFAFLCNRVRESGGVAVYAYANETTAQLLEKISFGNGPSSFFHLSGEAFHRLADLSGKPAREIVANIPDKELNKVARKQ
jgi:N-acetylglutamate synthase-like GNAT family acetyltransferase